MEVGTPDLSGSQTRYMLAPAIMFQAIERTSPHPLYEYTMLAPACDWHSTMAHFLASLPGAFLMAMSLLTQQVLLHVPKPACMAPGTCLGCSHSACFFAGVLDRIQGPYQSPLPG